MLYSKLPEAKWNINSLIFSHQQPPLITIHGERFSKLKTENGAIELGHPADVSSF